MDSLVSTDRCDSCGSQAYVRFCKGSSVLDFCGHHAAYNDEALEVSGWSISIDTRDLLVPRAVGAEVK
jgi:hypothetical protein